MAATTKFRDNVVAFTALPNSVRLVLLLVFLNSFRSFGLRFVQQLYLTNEFGLDDLEAASVLGTSASLHVAFGLIGAVLTDAVGVRRVALTALSISVVGRGLLAFGRSRTAIYAAFYLFSPAGEALLATGLYRVALKKLTTPKTRAFAFAVEYATFNLSGALADVFQQTAQAAIRASEASLLLASEPLWAAVLGLALLGEDMSSAAVAGGGLIFLGAVVASGAVGPCPAGRMRVPSMSCLLYTSPSPRDKRQSRMPSSA